MNSSKSWDLQVDPDVFKILQKMPRHDAEVILEVIRLLPINPHFGDIQKMKGEDNTWRRRLGSYRIFFRIKIAEKVVLVFHLERRTSKTY
ncbi:MAG: type II toxin-antitoxin system RelE/ParE family toxin [Candidatus Sungbacteria bacterium]|nr:type II toxin-antitoxin system RelE/ParE family toxin [Candidatus Sungbacteria bacterium]